jgi:hypothetical protein
MKTKLTYAFLLLSILGLAGCAVTDIDRTANFAHYKTYAWGKSDIDVSNPLYNSDLINKRIRQAVEEEFSRRGIVKNENDPDFIVRFHTYTEEKTERQSAYPYGYGYIPYTWYPFAFRWGYYPFAPMMPQPPREYTEGTLILDIVDHESNELVWRGSVSGNVDDVVALKKQIEKGVKAIMKKYPVTPDGRLNIGQDAIS